MPQVEKRCVVCLKPFLVYPYRAMAAKTCSSACMGKLARTRVPRRCRNCGKEFLINPSQFKAYKGAGKYCSRKCSYEGIVKETAGKPITDKYGRSSRKADQDWQKAVRIKDNYTCQRCGEVEKYIHAHHVAPRSLRPDLRHDISNGKCLCNSCHTWVHIHPRQATALGLLSHASYELAKKAIPWKRSDNVMITHNGETRCASEWAKVVGISAETLRRRKNLGWDAEAILTRPLRRRVSQN